MTTERPTEPEDLMDAVAFFTAVLGVLAALVCGAVIWLALVAIGG